MKKKFIYLFLFILLIMLVFLVLKSKLWNHDLENNGGEVMKRDIKPYDEKEFNLNLIKTVNSGYKSNYLISPYSIEIALNMLREGSTNNTKVELDKVVPKRNINNISNDKVKIANAVFVKDIYKDYIKTSYYKALSDKYNSNIIYDKFSTPDVINNWVKKNTDGMIDKILDYMDKDFVLGLSNAVAIDVEWQNKFECTSTIEEQFTEVDGTNINVSMMHNSYTNPSAKYFETKNSKGIILPYNNNLEFVGILPNDSIDKYINDLTDDELNSIDSTIKEASSDLHILLSLPQFSYSFDLDTFKDILKTMGIRDAFDKDAASFTNIITKNDMKKSDIGNLYVSQAIHKTYIDLNEKGTKAAAVTYFGMFKSSAVAPKSYEEIKIEFNRPFIYMIRDNSSKEILFFGVVYQPKLWSGSTCSE